jgi:excisionase family DNA binding protein
MTENFLSTEQVAQKLGITVRKVRRLIRMADLPAIKEICFDSRYYRIPESELLRWMDAHKIRRQ